VLIRREKVPWSALLILLLAVVARFWALDTKPPHFDEGVNGWFADRLTDSGYYHYDPTNYHGPLHMYAVFISQTLFGRNLWALRLPSVLASLGSVLAILSLAPWLGRFPVRFAALAMAVSPAFVFYGRTSIQESWMVLYLVITLRGIFGLWSRGGKSDLWWLMAGITGQILTKETYIVHLTAFALAIPTLWLWEKAVASAPHVPLAPQQWTRQDFVKTGTASALVLIAFYSGFFMDIRALSGLWETFRPWLQTGLHPGGHEKSSHEFFGVNYYWLALMARFEWPALAGVLGCFLALTRVDARVRYTAIFGAGALVAYSIIPYKTPWCLLVLLWPFYLVAGWFLDRVRRPWNWVLAAALILPTLAMSGNLNFRRFTDDTHPYVYVQTHEEARRVTGLLLKKARRDPRFYHATGKIFLSSYYPLPWVLGDFTSIGYYGEDDIPREMAPAFVVCPVEQAQRAQAALQGRYYRCDFRLRSGLGDCVAFFRETDFQELFPGETAVEGGSPSQP